MYTNNPYLIDLGQGLSAMVGLPTIDTWETKKRPKNAKRGTFGFNSETYSLEYWDGTDWYAAAMYSDK